MVLVADGILCLIHLDDGEVAQANGTDAKTTRTDLESDVVGCSAEVGNNEFA